MTALLPWFATLTGVVLFLYRVGVSGKDVVDRLKANLIPILIPLVFSLISLIASKRLEPKFDGLVYLSIGSLVGIVALYALSVLSDEDQPQWTLLTSILFPTSALAVSHWFKTENAIVLVQNGIVIGATLSALVLCVSKVETYHRQLLPVAVITGLLVATNALGRHTGIHPAAMTGLLLGLAGSIGVFVSMCLFSRETSPATSIRRFSSIAFTAIVLLFGGYLAAKKLVGYSNITLITFASIVIALFTYWLIEADKENSLRFGIATAIWVAAATIAFAERRAFGMAILATVGTMMLITLGSTKGVLALGPVIGLTLYRLFREGYPETTRALDLGQHYAMIGMIIGILLALIVAQWVATSNEKMMGKGYWGAAVWIVLIVVIPLVSTILLGPKGIVGYVVGLGFVAFIEGFKGNQSLLPAVTGVSLAFLMNGMYRWIGDIHMLTREDKVGIVTRYTLDVLALAVLLVLLSATKKRTDL